MDERKRFQFSVGNVLLMTFAVAWILGGVIAAVRVPDSELRTAAIVSALVILGISMAVGALVGGFKGMTRGFIVGACVLLIIALIAYLGFVAWMVNRSIFGGVK